jgi:hypothetical protein
VVEGADGEPWLVRFTIVFGAVGFAGVAVTIWATLRQASFVAGEILHVDGGQSAGH